MTFDEPLDESSTPAASAFTVNAAGSAVTVDSVTVSGATVILVLASEVEGGAEVTVAYTQPSANRLRDVAGNEAATFAAQEVENLTGVRPPGTVELSVVPATVTEGSPADPGNRTVTWTLTATTGDDEAPESDVDFRMQVLSVGDTAVSPGDYNALNQTLRFRGSDTWTRTDTGGGAFRYRTTKTGTVTVLDDAVVEDDEQFRIDLQTTPGTQGWNVGSNDSSTVTIVDADTFGLRMTVSPDILEQGTTTDVTVTFEMLDGEGDPQGARGCIMPSPTLVSATVGGTAQSSDYSYTVSTGSLSNARFASCQATLEAELAVVVPATAVKERTVTFTPGLDAAHDRLETGLLRSATLTIKGAVPARVTGSSWCPAFSRIDVSWTPVQGATAYIIEWKSGNEEYDVARRRTVYGQSSDSGAITGLANGTEYTVRVRAENAEGEGSASDEHRATPTVQASLRLVSLTAEGGTFTTGFDAEQTDYVLEVAPGTSTVTLDWSRVEPRAAVTPDPADADRGTPGYQVSLDGGDVTVTLRVSYLGETRDYTVRVRIVSDRPVVSLEAMAAWVPEGEDAKFVLRLLTPWASQVKVGLRARESTEREHGEGRIVSNPLMSFIFLPGEFRSREQIVMVRTRDDDRFEASSGIIVSIDTGEGENLFVVNGEATVEVRDNDAAVLRQPDPPVRPEAIGGNGQVTLAWDAPNDGGSTVFRYEYQVQRALKYRNRWVPFEGESDAWISTRSTRTSHVVRDLSNGLAQGQAYVFRVRAVNSDRHGQGLGAGVRATVDLSAEPRHAAQRHRPGQPGRVGAAGLGCAGRGRRRGDPALRVHRRTGGQHQHRQRDLRRVRVGLHRRRRHHGDGDPPERLRTGFRRGPGGRADLRLRGADGQRARGQSAVPPGPGHGRGPGGQNAPGESAEAPLTATLDSAPESHDGESAFTVRVGFSADIAVGAGDLGDGFAVTGGQVTGLVSVDDRADLWQLTITPTGNGDVTLVLEGGRACTVTGAPCTGGGGTLSATFTVTVPGPGEEGVTPLTGRIHDVPAEHDGSSGFDVWVAFTEAVGNSAAEMLQAASAADGSVSGARQHDGRSDMWIFRVAPSGSGPVTFTLAGGGDCSGDGSTAVCTSGGKALSNSPSATVRGPAALSVADAQATEGTDSHMEFVVSLSRAALRSITVDYATVAVTATEDVDYEAKSGTLTFTVGRNSQTVRVKVLDDTIDDDGETFTLVLSNPVGARIEDGEAVGTIRNSGAMPHAWVARFGRTVAEQVLDAVEDRMRAPRASGASVSLAGERIGLGPLFGLETAADEEAAAAREARALEAEAERRERRLADWLRGEGGAEERIGYRARTVTSRELRTGSSFALTAAEGGRGSAASVWGRTAVTRFDGREDTTSLDGEVVTTLLGADWAREAGSVPGMAAAGVILGHSRGQGGYRTPKVDSGTVRSSLTGVYPWVRYALSQRVSAWGVAGYGEGKLTLTQETGDGLEAMRTDLDLSMAAAGLRGILAVAGRGGPSLAVEADAMAVRTATAKVQGLAAAAAEVTRLRLGLESSWPLRLDGGGGLTPSFEIGVRHDGGDAESGYGADIGGGVAWNDPVHGLSAAFRGRGLLSHEASGFRERGFSGTFGYDPTPDSARGIRLSLSQTVGGASGGGMDALLGRTTLDGLAAADDVDDLANRRFEIRLGYGLPVFGDRFTMMSEAGFGHSSPNRDYSLGWRLVRENRSGGLGSLELALEIRRFETDSASPGHTFGLRFITGW